MATCSGGCKPKLTLTLLLIELEGLNYKTYTSILNFLFMCSLWEGGGSLGKNLSEIPFPCQIDMVILWKQ